MMTAAQQVDSLKRMEIDITRTVEQVAERNAQERSAVQGGLEVFHKVQLERDSKASQVIELEKQLAIVHNERDQYYREMVRYKRKAEHFERLNTAVLTQLSMIRDAIDAAQRVAATHAYGDRPSTAKKITEVDTGDMPKFLRGSPEKVPA
jgi:hypothetical protein